MDKLSLYRSKIEQICCEIESKYGVDTVFDGGAIGGTYIVEYQPIKKITEAEYDDIEKLLSKATAYVKELFKDGLIKNESDLWR